MACLSTVFEMTWIHFFKWHVLTTGKEFSLDQDNSKLIWIVSTIKWNAFLFNSQPLWPQPMWEWWHLFYEWHRKYLPMYLSTWIYWRQLSMYACFIFVCLFVYMFAPCEDTLGSWWDQTWTKCSSQALYSIHHLNLSLNQMYYNNKGGLINFVHLFISTTTDFVCGQCLL